MNTLTSQLCILNPFISIFSLLSTPAPEMSSADTFSIWLDLKSSNTIMGLEILNCVVCVVCLKKK